jgi:hypothetical protein
MAETMRNVRRDQTVFSEGQRPVVILYEHALLGEGIATYLRAQTGIESTLVSSHDHEAVFSALALSPGVVIFEKLPIREFDLRALAPQAVLIDVSTVITRATVVAPSVTGLQQILQAVRECSGALSPAQPLAL